MKKIFIALLFLSILIVSLTAKSQNANRYPYLRERLARAKLYEIRQQLKLDQTTMDRFSPVYLKYEKEIAEIDFRKLGKLMKVEPDSLSSEEADQLIRNQMENAKKLIEIREKYYKEFRTVLSPQQVIKLYQTEAEIRKKVMNEMKKRMISR
jgi:hypothetical protein